VAQRYRHTRSNVFSAAEGLHAGGGVARALPRHQPPVFKNDRAPVRSSVHLHNVDQQLAVVRDGHGLQSNSSWRDSEGSSAALEG
jgi:hypothetical protein